MVSGRDAHERAAVAETGEGVAVDCVGERKTESCNKLKAACDLSGVRRPRDRTRTGGLCCQHEGRLSKANKHHENARHHPLGNHTPHSCFHCTSSRSRLLQQPRQLPVVVLPLKLRLTRQQPQLRLRLSEPLRSLSVCERLWLHEGGQNLCGTTLPHSCERHGQGQPQLSWLRHGPSAALTVWRA